MQQYFSRFETLFSQQQHRRYSPGSLGIGLGCLLFSVSLQAEFTPTLEPLVITPGRFLQAQDQVLGALTVLRRDDLERLQVGSVVEALRGIPGLAIANTGGPGKPTSVFVRGTESRHVLVLIDGVRIGSATLGSPAWQDLPLSHVERIEVLRGPYSSLYGSDALGGVVQIITRQAASGWQGDAQVSLGSLSTESLAAGLSYAGEGFWSRLGLEHTATDGIDACDGPRAVAEGVACFADQPDRDGYRNQSLHWRGGVAWQPGHELEWTVLRAEGATEFDGSFQDNTDTVQQVLGLTWRSALTAQGDLTLRVAQADDQSKNYLGTAFVNQFDTQRRSLGVQWEQHLPAGWHGLVGLEHDRESVEATTAYTQTRRDNTGVFGQVNGRWQETDWRVNLRHDNDAVFGGETTGALGVGYPWSETSTVRAALGTAFKAPTFNDLYFPGFGNPELQPERAVSAEVGWVTPHWQLTAFVNQIDDLIAFDAARSQPMNIQQARIVGLEGDWTLDGDGWRLHVAGTLQNPKNRASGPNRGNLLPRRAEQSVRVDLDTTRGVWRWGGSLQGENRRFDDVANTRSMQGYVTAVVRTEYRISPHWVVQGRIENLFDTDYETAYAYPQLGRAGYVTLRYRR